jgi:hypothetical protein
MASSRSVWKVKIEIRDGVEGKVCTKCGQFKTLDCFSKWSSPRTGFKAACIACGRAYESARKASHGEILNERQRKYQTERRLKLAAYPPTDNCEICDSPPLRNGGKRQELFFDHNHVTGKFRGWLCNRCNSTLGRCKDDPSLLDKMADYLRERGNYANCSGKKIFPKLSNLKS